MKELPEIWYQTVSVDRSKVDMEIDFYEQRMAAGGEAQLMDKIKMADVTLRQALKAVENSRTPDRDRLEILKGLAPSLTTLRRYIGMAKLPACLDIIEEELIADPKMKIVLFAVHQSVIEAVRQRFRKYGAVTLYGNTPPTKRQSNVEKFMKNPKCRVFCGNIQAAGVGIDGLQKATAEVAFLEQDWVPANNAQAAMRVHRIGQEKSVRVRIFSLAKSVDEQIQETLTRKARELTRIF